MMRRILGVVIAIVMAGCASRKDSTSIDDGLRDGRRSAGGSGQKSDLQWGMLSCQKTKTCRNRVLNFSLHELELAVRQQFVTSPFDESDIDDDFRSFKCGRLSFEAWYSRFGARVPDDELGSTARDFAAFFRAVIETKTCVVKPKYSEKLQSYFEKQEEFRSENK